MFKDLELGRREREGGHPGCSDALSCSIFWKVGVTSAQRNTGVQCRGSAWAPIILTAGKDSVQRTFKKG